jgi:hypothetical protein
MLNVTIHEAKGLNNLSGRIKCRAALVTADHNSYSRSTREVDSQDSRSVEEYNNVKFDDATFSL